MAKVRESYVVVVGCGGVGSWAALMLLRRYAPYLSTLIRVLTTQRCRKDSTDRCMSTSTIKLIAVRHDHAFLSKSTCLRNTRRRR